MIDECPTVAKYILPEYSCLNSILSKDEEWISTHVQTSQYMTQITKCKDLKCCSAHRSSYFKIMNGRSFLPPPVPLVHSNKGIIAAENRSEEKAKYSSLFVLNSLPIKEMLADAYKEFDELPYDLYCSSVQNSLKSRICKTCHKYFATVVMLKQHIKGCHSKIPRF